jgi:hypothetical protein
MTPVQMAPLLQLLPLEAIRANTPLGQRLQDSSDAGHRVERCRDMAQKWREESCRPHFGSRLRGQADSTPKDSLFRNCLHEWFDSLVNRRSITLQLTHSLRKILTLSLLRMAAGLLLRGLSHALRASSRGFRISSPPFPDRINRISSKWHFAVANCRCFYTLRATGPSPVKTQARALRLWHFEALAVCWSRCSDTSALLGESARACNRIHRTGG